MIFQNFLMADLVLGVVKCFIDILTAKSIFDQERIRRDDEVPVV